MKAIVTTILCFFIYTISAQNFITTWKTDNPGTSSTTSITIPTTSGGYNYDVDWDNDGVFDELGVTGSVTHDFLSAGNYIVQIRGNFPRVFFNNGGDKEKLLSVDEWGDGKWTSMEKAFYGCKNLEINASDSPDLSMATSMKQMFSGAASLNQNLNNWDVSTITNMNSLFSSTTIFNQDLSSWNVSNVVDMSAMFGGAKAFNQDISGWNVGNVTNMSGLFSSTTAFNQPIGVWNVAKVKNMGSMFSSSKAFNQDISGWNTSAVTNMSWMFYFSEAFSGDINTWDVSNVVNMSSMFSYCSYNQPIGNWNTEKVKTMKSMFFQNDVFNQDIGLWNVSAVEKMEHMFWGATLFNQDIGAWNVSNVNNMAVMFAWVKNFNYDISGWNVAKVTQMSSMFSGATAFNQNIGIWDVSSVTNIGNMFHAASSFNQDLNNWDVSNVTNMMGVFWDATAFNGDISNWDVSKVTEMPRMFQKAVAFNGDITSWNVSSVTSMEDMFREATIFNQDISGWDVSAVTTMESMFRYTDFFNQDISSWNVASVTNMESMFEKAVAFDQNLGNWNVANVTNMNRMFSYMKLSTTNYDALLNGWNAQVLQPNVVFSGGNSTYCTAQLARDNITNTDNWTISDAGLACALNTTDFVTTWKTDNPGTSSATSITIPTTGGVYNYDVDWDNDGTFDELGITGSVIHDFLTAGTYTIRIRGTFPRIHFNDNRDKEKILSVDQWGDNQWISMEKAFYGCKNLEVNAADAPNLSMATSMNRMFEGASSLNQNINNWDVSTITDMGNLFRKATIFNQDLSGWDVSNVINMGSMFSAATFFNQNIGSWNVDKVESMQSMFSYANTFNQDISSWNVANVLTMKSMFQSSIFNKNINTWNVSKVEDMSLMFKQNNFFNQDIGNWDVSKVTNMNAMFHKAKVFNQDISSWSVAKVTNMNLMFSSAIAFDQPIGSWNVSNVLFMNNMFTEAKAFNQDIGSWDVSNVTNMTGMFAVTLLFNQDISSWNVSKVINMSHMFWEAVSFDQNLGSWDVSKVTNMSYMFWRAASFDQNIGGWNVANVTNMVDMFKEAKFSTTNYDALLNGWNTQTLQPNVVFHGGNSTYCSGETARNNITSTDNWTITDAGKNCGAVPSCAVLTTPSNGATDVSVTSDLSWSPVATATGYKVSIGTSSGVTDVVNNEDVGNVLTYNPSIDLLSNTIYYVTITAYNSAGDATGCTEISFTTETVVVIPSCTVLTTPSNGATNVSVSANLSWSSIAMATGYKVSVGTSSGSTDVVNNEDVGNVLTYNPSVDFLSNATYYVTITAYNSAGDVTGCTETSFTTETVIVIPSCAVLNSPSDGATDVSVSADLSWSPVATATGYKVSIGTSSGATDVVNNEDVGNVLTYNPSIDFLSNTTYYVTITAYNSAGDATGCVETSFTTETVVVIPLCTELTIPSNGATNVSVDSNLSWLSVATATGYKVSIGTSSGATDVVNNEDVGNVLSYNPTTDFLSNTTYYVTITAYNSAGDATGCSETSFTTEKRGDIKYGFSPDGDGINEYWEIKGIEQYPKNVVSIYNRWGDMVFEIKEYDNNLRVFRGEANKKKVLGAGALPSGTYFFNIQITGTHNFKKLKGFLILKR